MLNLVNLKYFYDAAALQSISQAARRNFVSQSALSQGIQKLELSFGVSLTMHKRQKFILTEEGKVVFEHARGIFQAVRNLQDRLNETQNIIKGELHFVCTNSLGMSFLPEAYCEMGKKYPDVNINFRLGGLTFIQTWLRQGIAEFGIVLDTKDFDEYEKLILTKGNFCIYKHKKSLETIEQGIFVDEREGLHVATLRELYRKKYGCDLLIKGELSSWEVVGRFAVQKTGLGFFPDYLVRNERLSTLEPVELGLKPLKYEICAIYPKGTRLSRGALAFLELLK